MPGGAGATVPVGGERLGDPAGGVGPAGAKSMLSALPRPRAGLCLAESHIARVHHEYGILIEKVDRNGALTVNAAICAGSLGNDPVALVSGQVDHRSDGKAPEFVGMHGEDTMGNPVKLEHGVSDGAGVRKHAGT